MNWTFITCCLWSLTLPWFLPCEDQNDIETGSFIIGLVKQKNWQEFPGGICQSAWNTLTLLVQPVRNCSAQRLTRRVVPSWPDHTLTAFHPGEMIIEIGFSNQVGWTLRLTEPFRSSVGPWCWLLSDLGPLVPLGGQLLPPPALQLLPTLVCWCQELPQHHWFSYLSNWWL